MTIVEARELVVGEVYMVAFGDWVYIAVYEGDGAGGKLRWTTQDMGTIDAWAQDAEVIKHLLKG